MNIKLNAVVFSLMFTPGALLAADFDAYDLLYGVNTSESMTSSKVMESKTEETSMESINQEMEENPTAAGGSMESDKSDFDWLENVGDL
ncbi:hypothetical protein ACMXYO_07180 [Neptuniibacter sp. QD37_6]|uniref:hypothetical protein n=1 Tax=Neptuniibacter sp. QD37_6 TaxID=3398210 RepID=UPI0039F552A8